MCLINNAKVVESLLREEKITCYKMLRLGYPYTGYLESPYIKRNYFPGWNQAQERKIPLCKADKAEIGAGIHVYRTDWPLNYYVGNNYCLLKCECLIEDLIGASSAEEAVFNKIYIPVEEIVLAIKKVFSPKGVAKEQNWIYLYDKNNPQVTGYVNLVHKETGKKVLDGAYIR